VEGLAARLKAITSIMVVGPEARGFIIGSAVAYAIGAGLILARKPASSLRNRFPFRMGLNTLRRACHPQGFDQARAACCNRRRPACHRRHGKGRVQAVRGIGRRVVALRF
jgi:hypothetical protein